jgi:hypothetical protein
MAEPAPTRDPSSSYIADILAKAPPMSRQQRDRLQVLLAQIHNARQQLRTASTASIAATASITSTESTRSTARIGSAGRGLAEESPASAHPIADVRPLWWSYPAQCSNHHEWKPGSVIVSWQACADCPAAVANQLGHLRAICRSPGCNSVWFSPDHLPR